MHGKSDLKDTEEFFCNKHPSCAAKVWNKKTPMPSHLQRAHLKWESSAQCRFKCWASVSSARPAAYEATDAGVAEAAEAREALAFFLCLGWPAETLSPRFRFPLGLEAAEPAAVNPQRCPRFDGGMKTNTLSRCQCRKCLCFIVFYFCMWRHFFDLTSNWNGVCPPKKPLSLSAATIWNVDSTFSLLANSVYILKKESGKENAV